MASQSSTVDATELFSIRVQNTFIHMVDESASVLVPKRCSSVPRSLRFGKMRDMDIPGSPPGKVAPWRWADVDVDDVDVSTEAGSSSEDDTPKTDTESDTKSVIHPIAAVCPWSAYPVPSPATLRPKLSSAATAWSPCMTPEASMFGCQLDKMMTAVQAVLMTCLWVTSVQAVEDATGWSIAIQMAPQHVDHGEDVLILARAALTTNVGLSGSIFMLGYQSNPFMVVPGGFAARLCGVPDENSACWGFLQQGFCRFAGRCRWQHPVWQKTITLSTALARS